MNKNAVGYLTIIILLSVTSFFSLDLYLKQRAEHDMLDIRVFPRSIGGWQGKDLEITEKEYEILETRNLISREYTNSKQEKINLFIIYSETNRLVFHPPEVCLMGGGMSITKRSSEKVTLNDNSFFVNKLYLEKDEYGQLVLYAYKSGNFYTDNFYLQQIYFAISQLFARHRGGATIRVSMPIFEDDEKALATLKSFMKETIKTLEKLS